MSLRSCPDLQRQPSAAPPLVGDAGGGVDFISGLNDDLLLRILELVPDAGDAVRTHALARRWRGLWTGVAALRFDFCTGLNKLPGGADDIAAERYLAFINDTLALRAAANGSSVIEDLSISFNLYHAEIGVGQLVPLSVEAAQGWIHYAAQHEVKSFTLKLKLPWCRLMDTQEDDANDIEHLVMSLSETDNYAKVETMHLTLGGLELRLPSSALLLPSLADLSLENIYLPAGGGYLLSRLVSSGCCPLLHKLRLAKFQISSNEDLLIESGTLLELSLEEVYGVQFLELRTPSLHFLHIVDCIGLDGYTAPALNDDVHDHLSSVETLKIQLFSRGTFSFNRNDTSIHLLRCCRLIRCLEVFYYLIQTAYHTGTVDNIKGRIPQLPNVTSLSVYLAVWERHTSGSGIASLLAHCSNIQYLKLELELRYYELAKEKNHLELDLSCGYSCHWKSHELSLAHLQEVEFKNLIGTNCEFWFIQSILTGARGIQKVTISFNRRYWPHAFKIMPPLKGGSWTACDDTSLSYKWRSEKPCL